MTDRLLPLFQSLPPEASVFLMAMLPLTELRASIPVGMTVYNLTMWEALFFSLAGNILIVVVILALVPVIVRWLERWAFWSRIFTWLFQRTRRKFSSTQARFGVSLGLLVFVAIPLPVTGGWTGALIAFLFDIPYPRALLLLSAGMTIAALLVGFGSQGVLSFFS